MFRTIQKDAFILLFAPHTYKHNLYSDNAYTTEFNIFEEPINDGFYSLSLVKGQFYH